MSVYLTGFPLSLDDAIDPSKGISELYKVLRMYLRELSYIMSLKAMSLTLRTATERGSSLNLPLESSSKELPKGSFKKVFIFNICKTYSI